MSDEPCQLLYQLIQIHGLSLCRDFKRCKALLVDLCPGQDDKIVALMTALEEGVVTDLLIISSSGLSNEVWLPRLIERIQINCNLTYETAQWVVECWALALGKLPSLNFSSSIIKSHVSSKNISVLGIEPALSTEAKQTFNDKVDRKKIIHKSVVVMTISTALLFFGHNLNQIEEDENLLLTEHRLESLWQARPEAGQLTELEQQARPEAGQLTVLKRHVRPEARQSTELEQQARLQAERISEKEDESSLYGKLTFGSQEILQNLWSYRDLQGSLNDKKISNFQHANQAFPPEIKMRVITNPLPRIWQYSIRRIKPFDNKKLIAFTFDLCEKANEITGYDAEIVNILRQEQVRATFFAGGKWMRSHPEKTMQLMADPFFEIGNHGWTHGNLGVLTGKKMEDQILWTQAQYELLWNKLSDRVKSLNIDHQEMDKIPPIPTTFRPPYGRCSSEALSFLADHGLAAIQWSIVSGDAVRYQTPQKIIKTVLGQAVPGAIVIFHGNGRGSGTAEALPIIIKDLKSRGYNFVTVSELLRSGEIIATEDCYELMPGDNHRYDLKFGEGTGE